MKPFSHFRLAETDKKKKEQAWQKWHKQRRQTTTCPAWERRNYCKFSQKNNWETSSPIWQRPRSSPSLNFSKPWTKETNGTVFQSVSVCVSECLWHRERKGESMKAESSGKMYVWGFCIKSVDVRSIIGSHQVNWSQIRTYIQKHADK